MDAPNRKRVLVPWAVFLGFAASFVGCCLAGRMLAKTAAPYPVVRYHRYVNPETSFYPTPDQVVSAALKATTPDKITVVVGGNSIFYGVGQSEARIWTKHLQELLGDDYQVLNLCLPGSFPFEFGGTAAEILSKHRPRLIYVTYASIFGNTAQFDHNYGYFVWYARERGLLEANTQRAEWMRELHHKNKDKETWLEFRKRVAVDRWCYCSDLWTTVSYHGFSTIWSPLLGPKWTAPRKKMADPDPGTAVPQPTTPAAIEGEMKYLRSITGRKDVKQSGDNFEKFCPPALKDRTLFLILREQPMLLRQLNEEERNNYEAFQRDVAVSLSEHGFQYAHVSKDYQDNDFLDRCHLTEPGGRRLAEDAAPAIREQAKRLGYLEGR